ncbi:MAG TPA: transporter [Stellaceae bacterium]|nr:transporter [Stellaceae bacterium]
MQAAIGNAFRASLVVLGVLAGGAPALGQMVTPVPAGMPDKSAYTLVNPIPADQLASFCTDRPTKSNLPCTVDPGHFQYESDIFNWTHVSAGGVTTDTFLYTNPTLKWGVSSQADIELNVAPAERVTVKAPSGRQDLTGVGDLFLRAKYNFANLDGGDFQATILPYVKVPTAKPGIGNKAVEGGLILPVSFALPSNFTLLFDPETDVLRNSLNRGRHANFQTLANLSHGLSDSVTAYVELWGEYDDDPSGAAKQASFDLAVSWVAWDQLPNLQFDVGTNIGLTAATPKLQAYAGVSQRF